MGQWVNGMADCSHLQGVDLRDGGGAVPARVVPVLAARFAVEARPVDELVDVVLTLGVIVVDLEGAGGVSSWVHSIVITFFYYFFIHFFQQRFIFKSIMSWYQNLVEINFQMIFIPLIFSNYFNNKSWKNQFVTLKVVHSYSLDSIILADCFQTTFNVNLPKK